MIDNSFKKTGVDIDGLLEVLGKNLYSTPSVALRELIQNAADACERHRLEDHSEREYIIDISCSSGNQLIIEDNGSGLTREEIEMFLATIGSGYSRLLRQQTETEDVIGYFGLGFLSAYVISSKVEVYTTSYKTPAETWKFASAKGKTYTVNASENQAPGTRILLSLETDFTTLSDPMVIEALIRRYCCLMPIPIHLNGNETPVNCLEPPWLLDQNIPFVRRIGNKRDFAAIFETSFEPIAFIDIPHDNALGLKGILWVQGGSSYSSSDNRNISIFNRNMFITNEDKELLPRWAGFCGAVITANRFKPTASRESLQRDDYYDKVAAFIHETLATGLRKIVLEEPETWQRVLMRHNEALLGAAIVDDRLFETMCRSLKVPTTVADMTIPQLLSKGEGSLYLKTATQTGYDEVLFRVRGYPLVKGYMYGAVGFCRKYHAVHAVDLIEVGSKKSRHKIFPEVSVDNAMIKELIARLFETDNHEVVFTRFDPEFVPLVVMEDTDVVTKNRIEADEARKRIQSAALTLARLHTNLNDKKKERIIFINLDNPVIQIFPDLAPEKQQAVKVMLSSFMEFLCLDGTQNETGLDVVFLNFNKAMLNLLA